MRRTLALLVSLSGPLACEAELAYAPCPCVEGYACCESENRCYPDGIECGADASPDGQGGDASEPSAAGGVSDPFVGIGGGTAGSGGRESGGAGVGGNVVERAGTWMATHRADAARSGLNSAETWLTPENVASDAFGKLGERVVVGAVHAQPLYAPGVVLPSEEIRNVVYVATARNYVYAFDADDPSRPPHWVRNLGPPRRAPRRADGSRSATWNEVGIVGTPVLSPEASALYAVTASERNGVSVHDLHKLNLGDGEPLAPAVRVEAPGFESALQAQQSALLLIEGRLWVTFGSYEPEANSKAWLFTYDEALVLLDAVEMPTHRGRGIWMNGHGPAAGDDGAVYFTVDSIRPAPEVAAAPGSSLTRAHYDGRTLSTSLFQPRIVLDSGFNELGAAATLPLSASGRVLVPGRSALYLLDSEGLATDPESALRQTFALVSGGLCRYPNPCHPVDGAPVLWAGSSATTGPRLFVWGGGDVLRALAFDPDAGTFECGDTVGSGCTTRSASLRIHSASPDGSLPQRSALFVTSDADRPRTGIVWASHAYSGQSDLRSDGIVRAYDAENLETELWNSERAPARDAVGPSAPAAPPVVTGGQVFVASGAGLCGKRALSASGALHTPAISGVGDQLVVAWVMQEGSSDLRMAWSDDGIDFNARERLDLVSIFSPAMASDGERVFLAWAQQYQQLRVIALKPHGLGGAQEFEQRLGVEAAGPIRAVTSSSPSLAFDDGELFLAWRECTSLVCDDCCPRETVVLASSAPSVFDRRTGLALPEQDVTIAPSLAVLDGELRLFWVDTAGRVRSLRSTDGARSFDGEVVLPATSASPPVFAQIQPSGAPTAHSFLFATERVTEQSGLGLKVFSGEPGLPTFDYEQPLAPERAMNAVAATTWNGRAYVAWVDAAGRPNVARYHSGALSTYGFAP